MCVCGRARAPGEKRRRGCDHVSPDELRIKGVVHASLHLVVDVNIAMVYIDVLALAVLDFLHDLIEIVRAQDQVR